MFKSIHAKKYPTKSIERRDFHVFTAQRSQIIQYTSKKRDIKAAVLVKL